MPIDLFQENPRKRTGKQRPNFEGDSGSSGTKTKLGNREHKIFFSFWGTGEQANLFHREQGNRYPPWEGPRGRGRLLVSCVLMRKQKKDEKGYYSFSSSAVRSAVIIYGRKNAIFVGKGCVFFYKFCKRLQKKESRRFNLLGLHWKGLLFD